MPATKIERALKLFIRGVFGGIAANLLKAIVAWILYSFILRTRFGYFGNVGTFFLFALLGIPAAAIAGGLIGLLIGAFSPMKGRYIGVVGRALIGVTLLVCFWLVLLAYDKLYPDTNRWSSSSSTWMIFSLFYMDFGLIIGAATGIMVGRESQIRE